jgi:rhodanese-related sulfurtransferase
MKDAISPAELKHLLDQGADIKVLDVRRREHRVHVEHPIPGAEWRDPEQIAEWSKDLENQGEVIVFCVLGHNVSQDARDYLRKQGLRARIVDGGIEAWQALSGTTARK